MNNIIISGPTGTMLKPATTFLLVTWLAIFPTAFAEHNITKWIVKMKPESVTDYTLLCNSTVVKNKSRCQSRNDKHGIVILEVDGEDTELGIIHDDFVDDIEYIEKDILIRSFNREDYSWGLDRISQKQLPLDGIYLNQEMEIGEKTHVYILDTGIKLDHDEFSNIGEGYDVVHSDQYPEDLNGHGTHCAGIAVGSKYGVAPGSILHGVKVMKDDSAWMEDIILGLDWVLDHHLENYPDERAVVSLSLGGYGYSKAMNEVVAEMIAQGIVVVAAAGNDNADACQITPANSPGIITVASIDNSYAIDIKSSFSNWGSCVDIYAPGSNIISASISSQDDLSIMSGTSMACPFVTGAIARILSKHPDFNVSKVKETLLNDAVESNIPNNVVNTTNKVLYSPFTNETVIEEKCHLVKLEIEPDQYPEEITWTIENSAGVIVDDGDYQGGLIEVCDNGMYKLTMRDGYGDGFDGKYALFVNNVLLKQENGLYIYEETFNFCLGDCPDNDSRQCTELFIEINEDDYMSEISWSIKPKYSSLTVAEGRSTKGFIKLCDASGDYIFTIKDSAGDGICCEHGKGNYAIYLDNELIHFGTGRYEKEEQFEFHISAATLPSTPDSPIMQTKPPEPTAPPSRPPMPLHPITPQPPQPPQPTEPSSLEESGNAEHVEEEEVGDSVKAPDSSPPDAKPPPTPSTPPTPRTALRDKRQVSSSHKSFSTIFLILGTLWHFL